MQCKVYRICNIQCNDVYTFHNFHEQQECGNGNTQNTCTHIFTKMHKSARMYVNVALIYVDMQKIFLFKLTHEHRYLFTYDLNVQIFNLLWNGIICCSNLYIRLNPKSSHRSCRVIYNHCKTFLLLSFVRASAKGNINSC